jgi:peptide deformylase
MASNVLLSMQKMIKREGEEWSQRRLPKYSDVREDVYRNPTITIEYCEED